MSVNLRSLFIITQIDRLLYLRDRFISSRYLLVMKRTANNALSNN